MRRAVYSQHSIHHGGTKPEVRTTSAAAASELVFSGILSTSSRWLAIRHSASLAVSLAAFKERPYL